MKTAALVLVETAHQGNLGAAFRIAANFGIKRLHLVRPMIDPEDPEVHQWACGAKAHLRYSVYSETAAALAGFRTVVGTASGRGRLRHPLITPPEAGVLISERGSETTALLFGNETRGLNREDLDLCDLVIRIPTEENFPVLNLVQSIAVILGYFSFGVEEEEQTTRNIPAPHEEIEGMMGHMEKSLAEIGYLDPANPSRILRKLRRIFSRAGLTENEVAILRGIWRQIAWAAGKAQLSSHQPGRYTQGEGMMKDE